LAAGSKLSCADIGRCLVAKHSGKEKCLDAGRELPPSRILGISLAKIAGIDDHAILGHVIGNLNQLNPFPYGKNTVFDSIVGRDSHLKRIRRVVS